MCSVDHIFEHNFYVVLIFRKRLLTFQGNVFSFDLLQKTEGTFFSFREKYAFSSVPEVKFTVIDWLK